jgi:hypothetical protein
MTYRQLLTAMRQATELKSDAQALREHASREGMTAEERDKLYELICSINRRLDTEIKWEE